MMSPEPDAASECQRLSHAADRWSGVSPNERAELAMRTARSVGEESDAWVRAAVAMKSVGPGGQNACTGHLQSLQAEECATGPVPRYVFCFLLLKLYKVLAKPVCLKYLLGLV